MYPSKATQEPLEITPGRDKNQEKGTRKSLEREEMIEGTPIRKMSIGVLKRGTKLKSLRIGGERSHMIGGQGMHLNTGTEKHPKKDKGTGDKEGGV